MERSGQQLVVAVQRQDQIGAGNQLVVRAFAERGVGMNDRALAEQVVEQRDRGRLAKQFLKDRVVQDQVVSPNGPSSW
jgi:hypothetical protein